MADPFMPEITELTPPQVGEARLRQSLPPWQTLTLTLDPGARPRACRMNRGRVICPFDDTVVSMTTPLQSYLTDW